MLHSYLNIQPLKHGAGVSDAVPDEQKKPQADKGEASCDQRSQGVATGPAVCALAVLAGSASWQRCCSKEDLTPSRLPFFGQACA